MKNITKKIMALLMVMVFAVSACACGSTGESTDDSTNAAQDAAEDTAAVDYGTTVTTLTIGDNEVLIYYPEPNAADTSAVSLTCTQPVFLVFGPSAYDEESAIAYATESGLAEIAAESGSGICFVNPVGETWGDDDASTYETVAQAISDSSTSEVVNGVTIGSDYTTGEETYSITGSQQRIYIYGIDEGADYIASVALKTVEAATSWGGTVNVTPVGVTLSGLTDVSAAQENDIIVFSAGNSDEINEALEAVCENLETEDETDYAADYTETLSQYRRQCGILLEYFDWEAEGIVETVETITVATSDDSTAYEGTQEHDISCVIYYAEDLDIESGNIPLVLTFHGGGNTALYQAQATQWPFIGKENGFITVSVDAHTDCTATEIVELIYELEEMYSIDTTKIYASGFSMGSIKCWDLYEQYPEVFAGLAPMDGSNEPGVDTNGNEVESINSDTIVPVFYVGGETSPLSEFPCQSETLLNIIDYLLETNLTTAEYSVSFDDVENWDNEFWGIDGDIVYQVTDTEDFTDSVLTVNLFESEDGIYYTALANASNQSHEVYARNCWAAWDFLSQFTRNSDGSITVSEVEYAWPSDDGSITDNSYNIQ